MTGIAPDGCPVAVYLALPPMGEAELVHAATGRGASVLDLGCGTGRIAHGLVELGHEVVGVDESAEMLTHVRVASTVQSSIAALDLDRTFDAVLMASHLLNVPDDTERRARLATGARHLAPGGRLIVQWHPPEWFERVREGEGRAGDVLIALRDIRRAGDLLSAVAEYRLREETWEHPFAARRLAVMQLHEQLATAGLVFDSWCTDDRTWFAATRH